MKHAERVHTRATLLDKIWGDHVFIEERTVDVHIKRRVKRNGRVEDMGEVVIQFGSLDELNGLIDKLRG